MTSSDVGEQAKDALFDYVITVCRESTENNCPIFPGITKRPSLKKSERHRASAIRTNYSKRARKKTHRRLILTCVN